MIKPDRKGCGKLNNRGKSAMMAFLQSRQDFLMKVYLHHPSRVREVKGPKKVGQLLKELEILPETVLVILKKEEEELMTEEVEIDDQDTIEIRPVISGGSP